MKDNRKNKHTDNILLFLATPAISKRIDEIREFIKIPAEIFYAPPERASKLYLQWFIDIAEDSDAVITSSFFKNELKKIKDDLKIKKIDQRKARELSEKLKLKIPINYLSYSIKELIAEYNLPSFYEYSLRTYITCGAIKFMGTESYSIRPNLLNDKLSRTVDIVVSSELVDQDLINIKKIVNLFVGDKLPKKIKAIKNIKKKLKIEEYHRDRDYVNPVDPKERFRSSAKDIVENIKSDINKKTTVKEVYEAPRLLKKLRKNRFGIN